MKQLFYEMRKNIIRKHVLIILSAAIILNVAMIADEYLKIVGFDDEISPTGTSAGQWKYYCQLHEELDGKIELSKLKTFMDTYQFYEKGVVSKEYSIQYDPENTKTGYFMGDYNVLKTGFYNHLEYLVNYSSWSKEIADRAGNNVLIYTDKENSFEISKNQYIANCFQGRTLDFFYDYQGWRKLLVYDKWEPLVLLLILITLVPCYDVEQKFNMKDIILASSKKATSYITYKRNALYIWGLFLMCIFGVINYVGYRVLYGLPAGYMPLYTLQKFRYTDYNGGMLSFYIFSVLLKYVTIIVLIEIGLFLGRKIHNIYINYILLLFFIIAGVYSGVSSLSANPVSQYLSLINPFSAFQITDLEMSCRGLDFFGNYVPWVYAYIAVQLVIAAVFVWIFNSKRLYKDKGTGRL